MISSTQYNFNYSSLVALLADYQHRNGLSTEDTRRLLDFFNSVYAEPLKLVPTEFKLIEFPIPEVQSRTDAL